MMLAAGNDSQSQVPRTLNILVEPHRTKELQYPAVVCLRTLELIVTLDLRALHEPQAKAARRRFAGGRGSEASCEGFGRSDFAGCVLGDSEDGPARGYAGAELSAHDGFDVFGEYIAICTTHGFSIALVIMRDAEVCLLHSQLPRGLPAPVQTVRKICLF